MKVVASCSKCGAESVALIRDGESIRFDHACAGSQTRREREARVAAFGRGPEPGRIRLKIIPARASY